MSGYWRFGIYFFAVLLVVAGMLGVSFLLGERHREQATGEPYESGIVSFGSAHLRVSAKFYLVALAFVIFDLEAVYIFAWAVSLYGVGWSGFVEMAVFIAFLLAGLIYLWRNGALDWNTPDRIER